MPAWKEQVTTSLLEPETEPQEERPKSSALMYDDRFDSEMKLTQERLSLEKVGGHMGQIAIQLHPGPKEIELYSKD